MGQRMTWPTRCGKCRRRYSKAMNLTQYVREHHKRCANKRCGGNLYVDNYRLRKERGRNVCACDHYHFPHRRGSLYCRDGRMGKHGVPHYMASTQEALALKQEIET